MCLFVAKVYFVQFFLDVCLVLSNTHGHKNNVKQEQLQGVPEVSQVAVAAEGKV